MMKPIIFLLLGSAGIFASEALSGAVEKQPLNMSAIIMFLIFVGATLGITYWAAKRTKTAKDFYTAGGGITGFQNGMAIAVMAHYNFNFETLFATAVEMKGTVGIMAPGKLVSDLISALSLGIALMFGTAGLPHILMRFFTVSDAKEARKSVFYATGFIQKKEGFEAQYIRSQTGIGAEGAVEH
jgi:Na+(H+)/acetate symporter ActP